MKALFAALALVAVSLAGCTDAPDDSDATAIDGDDAMDVHQIPLPEWQVGDWWAYDTTFPIGTFSLVVTDDAGSSWVMDTDHPDLAFFHAAFGEISYLGDIRKSDLAGSQEKGDVNWLDFPLEDGKTWTATWDGLDFDMTSHVSDDVAHIVASIDGTPINQMVYDAGVGWFTEMSWGDPETGEEFGRMDLSDSGSGFSGEVVRVDPVLAAEGTLAGPTGGANLQIDASSATDDSDAYLFYAVSCTQGSYGFGIGTFQSAATESFVSTGITEGQGFTDLGQACPRDVVIQGVIGDTPANGDQWGMFVESASQDLELSYQLFWRNFERISL